MITITHNQVKKGEGFYISYNDTDLSIYGGSTTALVVEEHLRFFILSGDHRDVLKGKSFGEALVYLHQHIEQKNDKSEDFPAIGTKLEDIEPWKMPS